MIQRIGKVVTMMSVQLKDIPAFVYIIGIVVLLGFAILYGGVLPRIKADSGKKERYRRGCKNGMIVTGVAFGVLPVVLPKYAQKYHVMHLNLFQQYEETGMLELVIANSIISFLVFFFLGILIAWRFEKKNYWFFLCGATGVVGAAVLESVRYFIKGGFLDSNVMLWGVAGCLAGGLLFRLWKFAFHERSPFRYFLRVVLILLLVIFLCGEGAFAAFHVMRIKGEEIKKENVSKVELNMPSTSVDETAAHMDDPDLVWHEGKAYRYNENLDIVLVMGIDQQDETIREEYQVSGKSGQADAIFLVVLDEDKNAMSLINMSRDTMTEIGIYDYKGNYMGQAENHLALAYAFGDGKASSCQYMADAVSNLFYGIPINGYVALNMQAVEKINDAVGGVEVAITEDIVDKFPLQQVGDMIKLNGAQAMEYIRSRDTAVMNSNSNRMERQKQYVLSLIGQAKAAVQQDPGLPVRMIQELSDQMVTNLELDHAVYLGMQALGMSINQGKIITLQGEAKQGEVYDEFYVDDDSLYELILQVFYNEEETGEKQ